MRLVPNDILPLRTRVSADAPAIRTAPRVTNLLKGHAKLNSGEMRGRTRTLDRNEEGRLRPPRRLQRPARPVSQLFDPARSRRHAQPGRGRTPRKDGPGDNGGKGNLS